jgi:hypothetical protein
MIQIAYMDHHAEDAQEIRSAQQNVRGVWPPVRVAQSLGAQLAGRSLLLGPLPGEEGPAG